MIKFDFKYDEEYYIFLKDDKIIKQDKYYFSNLEKLPINYHPRHKFVAFIKVTNDVYENYSSFITSSIEVVKIETIQEFLNKQSFQFLCRFINIYPKISKYIKNNLTLLIHCHPEILQYIENQTPELCKLSVWKYPEMLKFVKNQKIWITPKMTNFIETKPTLLCNIAFHTPYMNLNNYELFEDKFKWKHMHVNVNLLKYIKNPEFEKINYAILLRLLKKDGLLIKHILNQTEEMNLIALKSNRKSFKFMKNPTEKVCEKAIELTNWNIKYLKK